MKIAKETSQTPWDALGYATEEVEFRIGAERHAILLTDQKYDNANRYSIKNITDMTEGLKADNIKVHQVMDVFALSNYISLRQTGGVFWFFSPTFILDFPQQIVDKIIDIQKIPEPEPAGVTVVTSFGLKKIDTKEILGDNLLNDLDKDGLSNKSEINTAALEKFNPGKELTADNLITLQQFSEAIDKSTIGGFSDGILAKNKDVRVLPLKSDPIKADSDGDEAKDDIDATPLKINAYKNYIFYQDGETSALKFLRDEALHREKGYIKDKAFVEVIPLSTFAEFKGEWSSMGKDESQKEAYRIDNVFTIFHGSPWLIQLGETEFIIKENIAELDDKKINTLNLSSCNNGNLDFLNEFQLNGQNRGQNMAIQFLKSQKSIAVVKAWDGYSTYNSILFGAEYSARYDDFMSYMYFNINGFNEWSLAKNKNFRSSTGLITFTRKEDGSITYSPPYKYFQNGIFYEKTLVDEVVN